MIIKLIVFIGEKREAAFLKKNFTECCQKYCKFLFQSVLYYEISTPVLIFLKPYFSWKFGSFFILLAFSLWRKQYKVRMRVGAVISLHTTSKAQYLKTLSWRFTDPHSQICLQNRCYRHHWSYNKRKPLWW